MEEQNIHSWFDFESTDSFTAEVTVSLHLLLLMQRQHSSGDVISLHVNTQSKEFTFTSGTSTTTTYVPQELKSFDGNFDTAWSIRVETEDFVKLGHSLGCVPVELPEDRNDLSIPLPFLNFSFDGQMLSASRDWSRLGGPRISMFVPATGAFRGNFSSFAWVLLREMYFSDWSETDEITISFSLEEPQTALITGNSWGLKASLGFEYILEHRAQVVGQLQCEDIEVVADARIAFDPVVRLTHNGHTVEATIVLEDSGTAQFVRLSCLVMSDSPWNLELADEMNSWNNLWANAKLVREGTNLSVISEIPLSSLDAIADAVRNIVEKTKKVYDVVGVFI